MVNFTNNILDLTTDVKHMMEKLGYEPRMYVASQRSGNPKYTVRLSREVDRFISDIKLSKEPISFTNVNTF